MASTEKHPRKIIPFLWFDSQAEEAVNFYTTVFSQSKVHGLTHYEETGKEFHHKEPGTVMTVEFELEGQSFVAINGGPQFKFTPAVSFMVNCSTAEEVDTLWERLSEGGTALMPLDTYPFSKRYGWIQDKYGLSWQLILANPEGDWRPRFTPSLLFVGNNAGKAEEAMKHYLEVFNHSKPGHLERYGANQPPNKEGMIMYADFVLENEWFSIMDSALEHGFTFNEAISFQIMCKDQQEVDYYWEKLTANGGEESMCGWLKDRYGLSWQVVPVALPALMNSPDPEKAKKATEAMFKMKKIDINAIFKTLDI